MQEAVKAMDKQREKLIELLSREIFPREGVDPAEVVADYLLDNGVILPPYKVGDKLYCIIDGLILDEESFVSEETVSEVGSRGYWLSGCVGGGDDMAIFEPWETIGKTAFRSREEAEKALKGVE